MANPLLGDAYLTTLGDLMDSAYHADLALRLPQLVVLVRKSKQVARCYHQNKHSDNSSWPEPPRRQVSFDKRPHEIDRKPESEESRQDMDAEPEDP